MKSRSHRLPTSDPPDDWVNGSWTVDCVCGVNFDDGEEMVNCDECGVWVHTRCSLYVKGEKVFSCDKCKTKNSTRNDSEETEVAQLLIELPTKTLRTDNPSYTVTRPPPPRRPFRLWTDIPMEERVHVQGIPGGDPGLFDGSSSIFTPQLWRSTGHVPKKLNFQYREFPCWDEHQDADKKNEEKGNLVDKGVGALFSLLKENVLPTSVVASSVATKKSRDVNSCDKLAFSKDTKDRGSEYLDAIHPENGLKEDGTVCQPTVFHSGKRKKDDLGVAKDQSWRKKVKSVSKEADFQKRPVNTLRTVSTLSSDANPLEFYEDRVTKAFKADTEHNKNGNRVKTVPDDLSSDDNCVEEDSICNHKVELVFAEVASEALPPDVVTNNTSDKSRPDRDNAGFQFSAQIHISKKTIDGITSLDNIDSKKGLIKEEVANDALDKLSERRGCSRSIGIDSHKSEPLENKLASASTLAKDNHNFWHSKSDCCLQPNVRVKEDPDIDRSIGLTNIQSTPCSDKKLDDLNASSKDSGLSADQASKNIKVDDTAVVSLQFIDHKMQDLDGGMVVGDQKSDKDDESTTCQQNCQSVGLESIVHQKSSLEGNHGPVSADESLWSGGTSSSLSTSSILCKVACVGKSSPTSSVILNSRSSASDNHRPRNTESQNTGTRQKGVNDCNISSKKDNSSSLRDEDGENHNISATKNAVGDFNMTNLKDNASTDIITDEGGSGQSKKMRKELPKSSFSLSKASHSSKLSHASTFKRTLSDSKDALVSSSMKRSLTENVPHASNCGQSNLSQSENASCMENKTAASGLAQRGEKTNQSNCQTSSKVNHLQAMLPPTTSNPTAMLSDEELALLLHQELNSSPRVPRVPRIRHTGSLPQLGSPTSTGVLTKRASSSGGRDQSSVSRKKNKDFTKDGSRSSGNLDNESKKSNRGTSLHDQTRHDSACTIDGLSKKDVDNAAAKAALSAKKGMTPAPTTTISCGLSSSTEANEQNLSSTRNSPRNASDEDAGTARHPNHRTLPGLIAEIMSKGKRMTYEELCNAVLPHWPHLRKHNGERYAYTSHSHAVLDCLRNRNEWSQLVDRGPKTSASRKRRKVDANPSSCESGDNECSRDLTAKEVESQSIDSQRDYPKGKRKARKRRRLALQGRGIKDVRRRRKTDVLIDDDMVSFSNSSEESMFSDDEIQGGETYPNGSEAFASSNETGGTS